MPDLLQVVLCLWKGDLRVSTVILGDPIDHETALATVSAIRNFSGTGVAEALLYERSNVFLSTYNASCYTIHDKSSRAKYTCLMSRRPSSRSAI